MIVIWKSWLFCRLMRCIGISHDICFDKAAQQVLRPHKTVQVVMVRGICKSWKQPIFYYCDTSMTELLLSSGKYVILKKGNLHCRDSIILKNTPKIHLSSEKSAAASLNFT
ncbi:general transcription factor II-I repeat domain-containing protein 2-like [Aphis craccivora]|uniref:General transcription factor II-I repeat domain-containing protein 2-like n=1 Tax=Aphis craccivora TaxID=307492 RepID=A0A6G0YUN3_APHCR|nr:general transcription factor II-I repeat domain-containing protein 2-like [Aphis craccivora]